MTLKKIRDNLEQESPLVHCITNPISINQCANAILAVGARPIMAEHPREVGEITQTSQALMLNLGNITNARIKSIKKSLSVANVRGIPVVIDMVGIACSKLRYNFALSLCKKHSFSVIKGNYSEIYALYNPSYKSSGVDGDTLLDADFISKIAARLSQKYNTVVLASGKTDVITDGKRIAFVHNGTPGLAKVTGTGCMLGALCSAFITACNSFEASVNSCVFLGVCGEMSQTPAGSGSFMQFLLDKLSSADDEEINNLTKMEVKEIE